ncbi:hypothetical protein BGX33_008318 [Mortierella sp. NVP41]|nr:hypothetical protein BGX33_008318 [Mortierella sp. NVP41]
MARTQLPTECISCIISHLDGDLANLFPLLTVNNTFFKATLPILYRDPYRTLERHQDKKARRLGAYPTSISHSVHAKRLLYLLLLSCRQADDLVPFLNVDWPDPLSPFVSESPLMACYIDYLGDLDFDRWTATLKLLLLEFDTQMEQHAFRLFRLLFLDHHKERVQMLTIPITHIEPYMELLPHLKSLQRVRFYEDETEAPPPEPEAQEVAEQAAEEPAEELAQEVVVQVAEDVTAPAAEHTEEPVAEHVVELVAEHAVIPETEIVTEPIAEVIAEVSIEGGGAEAAVDIIEDAVSAIITTETEAEFAEPTQEGGEVVVVVEEREIDAVTVVEPEEDAELNLFALLTDHEPVARVEHAATELEYEPEFEPEEAMAYILALVGDPEEEEVFEPEEAMAYILALVGDPEVVYDPEEAMANILALIGDPEHDLDFPTSEAAADEEVVAEQEDVVVATVVEEQNNGGGGQVEEQPPAEEETTETPQPVPPVFDPTPNGVNFIHAHAALFGPGRVGAGLIEVVPPFPWIHAGSSGDITYGDRYLELLKALSNPAFIQFRYWERFRQYLNKIPLDGVKRLRHFYEEWPEVEWDQVGLVKQCRGLEQFSARIFDPTIFQWAIEEQKDREIYQELCRSGVAGASTSLGGGRSHGGHYGPGPDPVPLRKVNLRSYSNGFLIPVLQDICSVFKPTLESIICRLYISDGPLSLSILNDMPRLTTLDLRHDGSNALTNDTAFLRACPGLKVLRLYDADPAQLTTLESPSPIAGPWHLPCLEELVLVGTACDLFNYETLANTPQLQSIRLRCNISDMGVCKVDESYQQLLARPSWNWKWKLPRLHTLTLKGRPAHLFRPSLLLGCPRLRSVHLDVGEVPRSVTVARDVLTTTIATTTDGSAFRSPVRSLTLKGYWIMNESDTTVARFLQTWFNDLDYLKFESTVFHDHRSMLDGLYSIRSLRKVFLCRQTVSDYDAWKLELEETPFKSPFEWERKTRHLSYQAELQRLRQLVKDKQAEEEEKEMLARADAEAQMAQEAQDKARAEAEASAATATSVAAEAGQDNSDTRGPPVTGVDRPDISVDKDEDDHQKTEPTATTMDRLRCQSVDSAIALEEEQAQATEEGKIAMEEEQNDVFESMRCIYVFKGKRYRRKADTPQNVLCS